MSGMRQKIQYSLALELATRVKLRLAAAKGPNHSRRSQHPKARPWHRLHVGVQAEPRRTAGYVTRMPGGVGGVAPRGVPLSRSISVLRLEDGFKLRPTFFCVTKNVQIHPRI